MRILFKIIKLFIMIIFILIQAYAETIENISELIANKVFESHWQSSLNNPFMFFDGKNGNSIFAMVKNQSDRNKENINIERAVFRFFDPKYIDQKQIYLEIYIFNGFKQELNSWIGSSLANYTTYNKNQQVQTFTQKCNIEYNITILDLLTPQFYMSLKDPECQLDLEIEQGLYASQSKLQIIFYSFFTCFLGLVQYFCTTRLYRGLLYSEFQNVPRISLLTVGFVTSYDTCLSLFIFSYALQNQLYFQYLIAPSIIYLILSANCDLKFLWILWRARYAEELNDPLRQRHYFARFFIIFYTSIIVLYVLMKSFEFYNQFIILLSFFMVPQIIHNIQQGQNPKFIPEYIFGFLLPNIFQPLYFRANPDNFRYLSPSITFSIFWVIIFVGQLIILYLQYLYGPTVIVPKFFLPKQYQYYQSFKSEQVGEECVICLISLVMEPQESEQELGSELMSKQIMITPCQHKFHITCLQNWMDVKLTCPTCRKDIPPILN
ncbi:hypothetical protein pb186bvf_019505 [Paramecium bursaria]